MSRAGEGALSPARIAAGFLLFAAGAILLSTVLSPPIFWAVDSMFPDAVPFRRVFNRVLMVGALVLLWPVLRFWGIRSWKRVGVEWNPSGAWRKLGGGWMAGVAGGIFIGGLFWLGDARTFSEGPGLGQGIGYFMTGWLVGVPEEILFRGAFFLALFSGMARGGVLLLAGMNVAFFGISHFLKAENPAGTVTWGSGAEVWSGMVQAVIAHPALFGRLATLVLLGAVLIALVWRTRSLLPGIGFHAGVVLMNKLWSATTAPVPGRESFWFGSEIMSGGATCAVLAVLLALVLGWPRHERMAPRAD